MFTGSFPALTAKKLISFLDQEIRALEEVIKEEKNIPNQDIFLHAFASAVANIGELLTYFRDHDDKKEESKLDFPELNAVQKSQEEKISQSVFWIKQRNTLLHECLYKPLSYKGILLSVISRIEGLKKTINIMASNGNLPNIKIVQELRDWKDNRSLSPITICEYIQTCLSTAETESDSLISLGLLRVENEITDEVISALPVIQKEAIRNYIVNICQCIKDYQSLMIYCQTYCLELSEIVDGKWDEQYEKIQSKLAIAFLENSNSLRFEITHRFKSDISDQLSDYIKGIIHLHRSGFFENLKKSFDKDKKLKIFIETERKKSVVYQQKSKSSSSSSSSSSISSMNSFSSMSFFPSSFAASINSSSSSSSSAINALCNMASSGITSSSACSSSHG